MATRLTPRSGFRITLVFVAVIFTSGCPFEGDTGSQGPAGLAGAAGAAGPAGPTGPAGQSVLGFDRMDASGTTTSSVYADLDAPATLGPTVSFSLAAPGDVYVEFGAFMSACAGNNDSVFTSVSVDGAAPTDDDAVIIGQSFSDCQDASASRILRLSALGAGAHTIALQYRTDDCCGGSGTFARRWLRVTGS